MSRIVTFLTEPALLQSLPPILFDTAVKGALLVAITAVAGYLLRNRSAAARHAIWTAALLGHLSIPLFSFILPAWRIPLAPAPSWMQTEATSATETAAEGDVSSINRGTATAAPIERVESDAASEGGMAGGAGRKLAGNANSAGRGSLSVTPGAVGDRPSLVSVLIVFWLVGAGLVLLRLAVGTWRVGQLAREGARVEDGMWLSLTQHVANRLGVSRPLTLLRGERLAVPVTWGIVYPAVLLPEDADTWTEERKRFVLVHEMAHIKRFDALTQLLAQLSVAIFWFDPLVWFAAHRMRVEREHACDDYVLRDGTAPSLYAGELLTMVRSIGTPDHDRSAPAFAALAMARRSEFEGRMLAILDPRLDRQTLNRRGTLMTALLLALLTIPLAALRPFQQFDRSTLPDAGSITSVAASAPLVPAAPPAAPGSPSSTQASLAGPSKKWSCESYRDGTILRGSSTHTNVGDGPSRTLHYVARTAARCVEAEARGPVRFSSDERQVVSIAAGGFARFRERTPGLDRTVLITPDGTGSLTYAATFDGRTVPYDRNARTWLAGFLPEVLRESGLNVKERVARIHTEGGVPGVLR